jgi:type I restriction enzyme, R subunit
MSPRGFNEDDLIEQPAIRLFESLGWLPVNAYDETFVPTGGWPFGRQSKSEVVLPWKLQESLERLNPGLPAPAIGLVIEELTRDRSALSAAAANREVYELLKNGVRIKVSVGGNEEPMLARVIDWENAATNDYTVVSQFWISGEVYTRRADLVGFINGLPLVFIELKTGHRRIEDAYDGNLRDYRNSVPQLFSYNALIILSNGHQSRIGSMTSEWEHFAEWKKIDDEDEQGYVSLETMIRGTCEPSRLLDLVENFTLYTAIPGGTAKVLGKNHQYLGVNKAVARLEDIRDHWRKRQESRAGVWVAIADYLDRLPDTYTPDIYASKCGAVYQHVYDSYYGPGQSIYANA